MIMFYLFMIYVRVIYINLTMLTVKRSYCMVSSPSFLVLCFSGEHLFITDVHYFHFSNVIMY
jgi:hypothetical protein